MYTNADQILNKRDELVELITGNEPHIIMISEVIPKGQIHPIEAVCVNIQGYNFHLNFDLSDRNLGGSGIRGVAIYVKDDLITDEIAFTTVYKDHVWVEIRLANAEKLLCGCIYRSPTKEKEATKESTK